jgi:hypothetical protein
MSAKKSDDEEFVGHAAHVSQMPDFELPVPPQDERPASVWHMYAADEAKSKKSTAKQSPSGAAHAEQEK